MAVVEIRSAAGVLLAGWTGFRVGTDAARYRSEDWHVGMEPAGLGQIDWKIRRGQPDPEVSRLPGTKHAAPPVSDEHLYNVVDAIDQVAAETGKTVPQIALNWLLQRPTITSVIIGARNEEQLRQNLAAVGWNLSPEQVARLDAASAVARPYPYWHQQQAAGERNPLPC